ncbi:MAG: universal stress protein [Ilyomonas sp.]
MKTILVCLDFSEFSKEVEKVGYEIAKATGNSVTLVTIINKSVDYTTAYMGLTYANQWEELLQRANVRLEKIRSNHHEIQTNILSFIGSAKEDIVAATNDNDVSFIVVGKHGRTGLTHLIMGGTTSYIVQHSVKPVIVVPFKKSPH